MAEANGGQPTRDERIQRQDRDRGDPNDDVLAGNFMYHVDDGDCRVAGDFRNLRPMSRRAAKRRWLAPCMVCVLEVTVK